MHLPLPCAGAHKGEAGLYWVRWRRQPSLSGKVAQWREFQARSCVCNFLSNGRMKFLAFTQILRQCRSVGLHFFHPIHISSLSNQFAEALKAKFLIASQPSDNRGMIKGPGILTYLLV